MLFTVFDLSPSPRPSLRQPSSWASRGRSKDAFVLRCAEMRRRKLTATRDFNTPAGAAGAGAFYGAVDEKHDSA